MLKAAGRTADNRPVLLLGLSGENMTRLMAGEPIDINAADLGLPAMQIVILGGRTEQAILDQLHTHGLAPRE